MKIYCVYILIKLNGFFILVLCFKRIIGVVVSILVFKFIDVIVLWGWDFIKFIEV